ncbi:MAG TPA: serine/threonine-protein kinase, partial [Vicinamibacterales bacterium]|nr:serine/threonine-protein kinase [Vicinamibacterales bacterium]
DAGTAAASRAPSDQTPSPSSAPRQPSDRAASDPRSPSGAGTSSGWLSSSGAIDHGRFAPGALLGGRYRIIQRLGRGGMGEVYRADDLKLGQPVALKFLSADVDRDPARLTQLHSEVRMARQVSHPNVCRVYDIDEVDGSTFLSMEYVDGEDLASLLRRIGRFPEDRGLEIARQICAGLAAAHERGVVHRDLKPANIMLDGTGKVRITDFGLAGLAGESIRAGTPAYMSPEQLAGDKVSAKSDIYSLGLVLYEVFTGQRALEGRNLAELIHKREQSGVVPPTEIVKTLDPKIEAAILRCLRPTPDERPASALTVAAALPGGDPLAAALAAGETPSPEMVAAAGPTEALHPALGLSLVAFVVAALMAYAAMSDRYSLFTRVPMRKSLDSLQDRARDILGALGYEPAGQHSTRGLAINFDVIRHIRDTDQSADRWNALNDRRAPVMVFWYRSSPQPLVPIGSNWNATLSDPPMAVAGMTRVSLDDTGKLVEFEAVPPRADDPARPAGASPWPALFQAAGLDLGAFHPVDPVLLPKAFATERAAWEGPAPGVDGATLHVEASAHRGAAISFRATGPWEPAVPRTTPPIPQSNLTWRTIANTLGSVLVFATLLLARSNLRAGRGDRRGAWRLLCVAMAALVASWIVSARHYTSLLIEDERLFEFLAHALMNAGTVWLLYIALEPYVRRFAPGILISWTRVLSGRIVDPRVGRDLLVGAAVGVSIALLGMTYFMVPELLGEPPGDPRVANLQLLLGTPVALGAILRMIPNNLQNGLFVAFAFGVGRVVTRRVWGGAVLAGGLLGIFVLGESTGNRPFISLLYIAALVVPLVVTLLYCGVLSVVIAFLVNQVINNSPLTLQPSMPYATAGLWAVLLVVSLAAFGFYASRGGQPLFGRLLQAD